MHSISGFFQRRSPKQAFRLAVKCARIEKSKMLILKQQTTCSQWLPCQAFSSPSKDSFSPVTSPDIRWRTLQSSDEVLFCFTLSRFPRTIAQEKSTHAGGIASRVTMRPLEMRRSKQCGCRCRCRCRCRGMLHSAQQTQRQKKRKPWKFQATPMEQIKEAAKWNDQKGP
jgi:hypothetical protein